MAKEVKQQSLKLDGPVSSSIVPIVLQQAAQAAGVSPDLGPSIWPLLFGVEKARAAKGEQVYPALLQRCEGKDRNHELELDLDRTFPGHPLLDRESAHGAPRALRVAPAGTRPRHAADAPVRRSNERCGRRGQVRDRAARAGD